AFSAKARADTRWVDMDGAGTLARLAMEHEAYRSAIFYPLDQKAEFEHRPEEAVGLGLFMREHIRLLSRAVAGYPGSVPDELVEALASAVRSGSSNHSEKHRADAFTYSLDSVVGLESDLIEAVNRLEVPAQQQKLIEALLLVEEPLVLALLLPRVPAIHHEAVRKRLLSLTPQEASSPTFVTQITERVQAFLDAGLPDMATAYLREGERVLRGGMPADLAVQRLNLQLQIHYLSGDFGAIRSVAIPDGLQPEQRVEAQRTRDFFRALVCLKMTPPAPDKAVEIFRRLYQEHSFSAYAINLLAARIAELFGEKLFRTLTGEEAEMACLALAESDQAIPRFGALSDMARAIHIPNYATMLLALGEPRKALNALKELSPTERSLESTVFEAIASARLGEPDRARALIRSGEERYGSRDLLEAARNHIDHSAGFGAAPRTLSQAEERINLRAALKSLMEFSPSEQAAIISGSTLDQFLTTTFQDALAAFHRTLSFLKLDRNRFDEDDFNGIVAALVEARLEGLLGWQAHEQSPGGYTRKGNAGRRDFAIRRRGEDIAMFEALKASQPNDQRIKEHLHKLFGYSSANILFLVIYSDRPDASEMRDAVWEVAAQPPTGTTYLHRTHIAAEGVRPAAIRGAYKRDGIDVTVIFFVIDMRQSSQRAAVGAPTVFLGAE
ncbi:MAG: hypothetical protein GX772_11360, partial [Alcaligenaceae bacterium]|nr:hypothetical protein [Alcaligenaceae bacterium]